MKNVINLLPPLINPYVYGGLFSFFPFFSSLFSFRFPNRFQNQYAREGFSEQMERVKTKYNSIL